MIEKLFLSVGAMKAGTTWLYDKFKTHPEIHFCYEKELHYFAHRFGVGEPLSLERRQRRAEKKLENFSKRATVKKLAQVQAWYADYETGEVNQAWFERLMESETHTHRYLADFSNLTCMLSPQDWAVIKQETQHLKVIYILRDPIKRLWSHYKFHLHATNHKNAHNPLENFKLFKRILGNPWFIRNAFYSPILTTLNSELSKEQFKLCYFEEMIREPAAFLADIERFLAISNHQYNSQDLMQKKNPGIDVSMPTAWRDHSLALLADEISQLKNAGYWHTTWTDEAK